MKLKVRIPVFDEKKPGEILYYHVNMYDVVYSFNNNQGNYIFTVIDNAKEKEECSFDIFLSRVRACNSEIIFESKKEKRDFVNELFRLWKQEESLLKLYNYFIYRFEPSKIVGDYDFE